MYCILVTGIPAAGKSTIAQTLAKNLKLPVVSKDSIKELLFDCVGFRSREEKVNLGTGSMEIMYYVAGQLMEAGLPFILENNFEYVSEHGMKALLEKYQYPVLTIVLFGKYQVIYQRFLERNASPDRHRGHVVNDCYPEKENDGTEKPHRIQLSYEEFVQGIRRRGFEDFSVGGERLKVDTTDFSRIDMEEIQSKIEAWRDSIAT